MHSYMIMSVESIEDILFRNYKGKQVKIESIELLKSEGVIHMEVSGEDIPEGRLRMRIDRDIVPSDHKAVYNTVILAHPEK